MKRPLLFRAICLSAGIFCSHLLSVSYAGILWPFGFLGVILIPFLKRAKIFVLCALFFYLGFVLYQYHAYFPSSGRIDQIRGIKKEIGLRGEIADFVEILGVPHCILKTSQLGYGDGTWMSCRGNVLVRLAGEEDFQNELYDQVELHADVLNLPLKNRDQNKGFYTWFLAHEICMVVKTYPSQIRIWKSKSFLKDKIIAFKNFCAKNLEKGLPPDSRTRPLLKAMMLGERGDFPPSLKNAFLCTNTIHILSISGLHLTIILMAMLLVFGLLPVSRNWVRLMGLIGIWFYAVMTVLQPPILRSAIMASFFLVGSMLRKKVDLANVLGASALGMLLFRPLELFDPGFQLSFLCLLALIFLSPMVERDFSFLKSPEDEWRFQRNWKDRMAMVIRRNLMIVLSGSVAVWVGVLPLIAYHFKMVSPVTVLANLAAVPLVGVIMNIGFASCVLGAADWIAVPLNAVNHWMAGLLEFLLRLLSNLPGAYFFVARPTVIWIVIFYMIVFTGCIKSNIKGRFIYCAAIAVSSVVLLVSFHLKGILRLNLYETDQYFMRLVEWPDYHKDLWVKQLNAREGKDAVKEKTILGWRLPQIFRTKNVNHIFLETKDEKFAGILSEVFPAAEFEKPGGMNHPKDIALNDEDEKILFKAMMIRVWNPSPGYSVNIEEKDLFNVFLLSKSIRYGTADLAVLDQISSSMVILGANVNKKLSDDVKARKIPCLEIKKGKPLCLETDGEKIWTVES